MTRIIKSGNIIEMYVDDRVAVPPKKRRVTVSWRDEDVAENRRRAAKRAKQGLKRLVWANYTPCLTAFLTFTFNTEKAKDYEWATAQVELFFKRLVWNQFHKRTAHYKYVAVPETQKKSGRWHYHVMVFNWPYLDVGTVAKTWGQGGVDIKRVFKDSQHCANYLCKYFSKTFAACGLYGKRRYYRSKNLRNAVVFKGDSGESYFQNFKFLEHQEIYRYVTPDVTFIYSIWVDKFNESM